MPSYLILDAYNVIGALERYRNTDSFDAARESLVNDALKAAGWTGREIYVVFDAQRSPEQERIELLAGGAVRVVYSAPGESADDFIERLMGGLHGDFTVYTADFALQRTVLARSGTRATPREFQDLLDELPAVTRRPDAPRRYRIADHISAETRVKLEEIRRRAEGG